MSKKLFILKILTLTYLFTQIMPVLSRWSCKEAVDGECFVLNKENEAIIRSVILSRGREGCTLKQIKGEL